VSEKRKEFTPDLENLEDFRQGYQISKLDFVIPGQDEKRYRLDFLITVPGIERVWAGDKLVRVEKTYRNFILSFFKKYKLSGQVEYAFAHEPIEDGIESLNPSTTISKELIANFFSPRAEKTIETPNPRDVFFEVMNVFDAYIEADRETITLLSVYTIATYFFRVFNTFPYLYIFGPKQSGKTKLLALMTKLCYNAVSTVNLSASALFRLVNDFGTTLVIDESEYLRDMEKKGEIQTLLLAGYKKDGANVLRVEGEEKKQVKLFNVFGPKIMASINYPHDILLDRCIIINMLRGKTQKINLEPKENFQNVRDKLYLLLFTKFDEVYELREKDDFENPYLVARERELWRPLLIIAYWLGQYMSEEERGALNDALNSMIEQSIAKKMEIRIDSEFNTFLTALSKLVKEDGYYAIYTIRTAILDEYRLDDDLFKQAQKYWTPERIGRMLAGLLKQNQKAIRKVKRADGAHYYITVEDIKSLCERYGVEVSEGMNEQNTQSEENVQIQEEDWRRWFKVG